jgi:hypothetical protein
MLARWDFPSGITFDEESLSFQPERDEDELVLQVLELQSGQRIEVVIPGMWES